MSRFSKFARRRWPWVLLILAFELAGRWAFSGAPVPWEHVRRRQLEVHLPWAGASQVLVGLGIYAFLRESLPAWLKADPRLLSAAIAFVVTFLVFFGEINDIARDGELKTWVDIIFGWVAMHAAWVAMLWRHWWNWAHLMGVEEAVRAAQRRRQ